MGVRRCDERTGTRKEIPPYTRRPLPSFTSNSRVSASYPSISTPTGEDLIFGQGSGRGMGLWGLSENMENGAHPHTGYGAAVPRTHIRRSLLSTSRRGSATIYLTRDGRHRWAALWHICTDIFSYCIITIRPPSSGGLFFTSSSLKVLHCVAEQRSPRSLA
jgi:hypothetical protein